MRRVFLKVLIFFFLYIIPLKTANCEVFIVAKVNQKIITNVDLDFEKRYLISEPKKKLLFTNV